jgi:hypothetical protein
MSKSPYFLFHSRRIETVRVLSSSAAVLAGMENLYQSPAPASFSASTRLFRTVGPNGSPATSQKGVMLAAVARVSLPS